MDRDFKLVRIFLAMILLLLLATPVFSESAPSSQARALLEYNWTWCMGPYCSSFTHRLHADGRFIQEGESYRKTKSGRFRKVLTRGESQLEAEEVAEFVSLAEQPDFLNAQPKYVIKIVQDNPSHIIITYRKEGREKKVEVANFIGKEKEEVNLPLSLLKLIKLLERLPDYK